MGSRLRLTAATAVLAFAVVAGTACGDVGPRAGGPAAETSSGPAATETDVADVNPVIADDFPDPDVLEVDGTYYAYATNGNNRNVRVASSPDLLTWGTLDDALPELPSWVIPGKTWAPEVTQVGPGRFVLYFTATNFEPALQCIGVAVAEDPAGPFEVVGDGMLVCPEDEGGAIDASTFLDEDGTRYLLWKNDGNCCGLDTWLQLAPLTADGTSLAGDPVRLVRQDQGWEGNLVEAPTLVRRDGRYVLLYSANDYGGPTYAIGYATAAAVSGPYEKPDEALLTSYDLDSRFVGPGGQDVVVGPDGKDRIIFHSWYGEQTYRAMNVLPLAWHDGAPVVTPP